MQHLYSMGFPIQNVIIHPEISISQMCVCVCVGVCRRVCTCIVHRCVSVCMYACMSVWCIHDVSMLAYIHAFVYLCVCTQLSIPTNTCGSMYFPIIILYQLFNELSILVNNIFSHIRNVM